MAHLTEDKRHLILTCKQCGGEVRYSTNYPLASESLKSQLKTVLEAWEERAEICESCLFGPTIGAPDVEPQPQASGPAVPQSQQSSTAIEVFKKAVLSGSIEQPLDLTIKDHTPPRLYDVKECQALLRMSHGRTLKFIREEIIPLGGCSRIGNRYLVQAWAINHALSQRTLQPRPKKIYSPARLASLARGRSKSKTNRSRLTSSETLS